MNTMLKGKRAIRWMSVAIASIAVQVEAAEKSVEDGAIMGGEISDVVINSSAAASLSISAKVQGRSDVFVEYAHRTNSSFRSVKDRYVTNGLIAMWDGEDNQGTGAHVESATDWVDLAGKHAALIFETAPTVLPNAYDVSQGGGTISSCADIAQALYDGHATVEIVVACKSYKADGTLFSCVNDSSHRIAWVRTHDGSGSCTGMVAGVDYCADRAYTPYPNLAYPLETVQAFAFVFGTENCQIFHDGQTASPAATVVKKDTVCTPSTAWFSLGQRFSSNQKSAAIADARIYCVRVYDRILSADEIAANHAQDVARFVEAVQPIDLDVPGDAVVETNLLWGSYATEGLIAMWDGEDNQGTGVHQDDATDWVDLTGRHAPMNFNNKTPVVNANNYDLSGGGCYLTSCSDIAQAFETGCATVEIVFDAHSYVNDGTLFSCVDGSYNRLAWIRMNDSTDCSGVVGSGDYRTTRTLKPYPQLDKGVFDQVRAFTFKYDAERCRIFRNGDDVSSASITNQGVVCAPSTAWFSLGQRFSASRDPSGAIADIKVYCVRVYDRVLSDEEVARNHALDRARFFGASGTGAESAPLCYSRVLKGLRPDITDYTVRLFTTNEPSVRTESVLAKTASELPDFVLDKAMVNGKRLVADLTRTGTSASSLFVAYGSVHGGKSASAWQYYEPCGFGFAEDERMRTVEVRIPGLRDGDVRYVRFFSQGDGWSDSVYLPETPVVKPGLILLFR